MFALEPLLRVERIRFCLSQIQRSGDIFVLVLELVDGAVERGDLGGALGEPDVVGVGAHHGRVDEIDDAEVRGLGGVAMRDLLDVAEDLAFLLRDGQQFAGLDQRVDLHERLGQPGQTVGFVEHELADELLQSANTFQRLALAEQLLGGVGGADADSGVQLREVLRFDLGGEPSILLEDARVEAAGGPAVADVFDVEVAIAEHESARRIVAGLAGQPLEHQPGDGAAGVAGIGDRDRHQAVPSPRRGRSAMSTNDIAST